MSGALCAAIVDQCAPSSVTGVEPSEGFLKAAKENVGHRASLHPGTARAMPLADASMDVVVSGPVRNFVPDQQVALHDMTRVADRGSRPDVRQAVRWNTPYYGFESRGCSGSSVP